MDALREGVGLRAYGQRDPLVEYKREAFDMFGTLMTDIREEACSQMFRSSTSAEAFNRFMSALPQTLVHDEVSALGAARAASGQQPGILPDGSGSSGGIIPEKGEPVRRDTPKVGRNDPCPCGSGKKYKKCCGAE